MSTCPKCGGFATRTNIVRRTASLVAGSIVGSIIAGNNAHGRHTAESIFNLLTPTKKYVCTDCGYSWEVRDEAH